MKIDIDKDTNLDQEFSCEAKREITLSDTYIYSILHRFKTESLSNIIKYRKVGIFNYYVIRDYKIIFSLIKRFIKTARLK